ncbi:uncharacterized protein BJ212DRAFT_1303848 [Suillus subaureus]|uniref:Uncharacterized protein n=1 Tax=Suillus subaureus TaxID=48587 RepID=A0A9P7J723_9AGAM|nr:uncharacterized protein BJ212DRAFT_1303848 [Suillus subaureus]KAG1805997.1 hypothetical protein BJ212DRAFT_1303848 [Suillus subaureus]
MGAIHSSDKVQQAMDGTWKRRLEDVDLIDHVLLARLIKQHVKYTSVAESCSSSADQHSVQSAIPSPPDAHKCALDDYPWCLMCGMRHEYYPSVPMFKMNNTKRMLREHDIVSWGHMGHFIQSIPAVTFLRHYRVESVPPQLAYLQHMQEAASCYREGMPGGWGRVECTYWTESKKKKEAQITYRELQETQVIDVETTESYKMYQVPAFEGGQKWGLILLPMRCCGIWLELSQRYEEVKRKGGQYGLYPVMVAKRAFFKKGWNIHEQGKESLPPTGSSHGSEDALREFQQSLNKLRKPSAFHQTQHLEDGELPVCWHKEHNPCPFSWSEAQWEWYSRGTPITFFNFVLRKEPNHANVTEFEDDIKRIAIIVVTDCANGLEAVEHWKADKGGVCTSTVDEFACQKEVALWALELEGIQI